MRPSRFFAPHSALLAAAALPTASGLDRLRNRLAGESLP
jgi:hypothetical protein